MNTGQIAIATHSAFNISLAAFFAAALLALLGADSGDLFLAPFCLTIVARWLMTVTRTSYFVLPVSTHWKAAYSDTCTLCSKLVQSKKKEGCTAR